MGRSRPSQMEAHLELPQSTVLVPVVEHVTAPAGEVMRLEHLHLVSVLGEEGGGAQAADSATDDDDVVLLVGVCGGGAGGGRDGSVRGNGTRDRRRIAATRPKRANAVDGRDTRGRRDRWRRATERERGGDARRAPRAAGDGRARGARRHRRRGDGHHRRRSRRTRPRRARSRSVGAPRRCSRTGGEPVHDLCDSPSVLRGARPAFRGDALERRARNAARWLQAFVVAAEIWSIPPAHDRSNPCQQPRRDAIGGERGRFLAAGSPKMR